MVTDSDDDSVQVFGPDGAFLRKWGSQGSGHGQFHSPWGVAVRGDEVLVADRGNHRVQVFHLDGSFVRACGSWGSGDGQFDCPTALTVTRAGEVLVGDSSNGRVVVLE